MRARLDAGRTLTTAESGQKAISSAPVTVTDPGHTHTTTPASPVFGTNSAVQSGSNTLI